MDVIVETITLLDFFVETEIY